MTKFNKKISISLCLGTVTILAPASALLLTSCAPIENTLPEPQPQPEDETQSSIYEKWIGRNITWITQDTSKYSGILLKVENKKIWIESHMAYEDYKVNSVHTFNLPLTYSSFTYQPDLYGTSEHMLNIFEILKSELAQINYYEIEKSLENFANNLASSTSKEIANKMLHLFKTEMNFFTIAKMDEIILDIKKNSSLNKWHDFIKYYLTTFIWKREELYENINNLEIKHGEKIPDDLWNRIKNLSGVLNFYMSEFGSSLHIK